MLVNGNPIIHALHTHVDSIIEWKKIKNNKVSEQIVETSQSTQSFFDFSFLFSIQREDVKKEEIKSLTISFNMHITVK